MTYAVEIMQAAIKNSKDRSNEFGLDPFGNPYVCCGSSESRIGKVTAVPVESRNRNSLCRHHKMRWKLNNKAISGDNLADTLNA